jgi:hypothetical protein
MDTVNVHQDMANIPQDMERVYVDMDNIFLDMVHVSYGMFKVPRKWYIYAPRHDKVIPDMVKYLHTC